MRKVQVSFDFLVIVIFAFMIFLELFEVYATENSSARIRESVVSATRIASSVARAINEVSKENGTSTSVTLPESLDTGDTYYLSIAPSGRRVDVFWPISAQNRSVGVPILTNNVTGPSISQMTGAGQASLTINNVNGFVRISVTACTSCLNCLTDCTLNGNICNASCSGGCSNFNPACNSTAIASQVCSNSTGGTSGSLNYQALCCNGVVTSCGSNSASCNTYCNTSNACSYPSNPVTCSNTCSTGACQTCTASCGTVTCTNCGTNSTSCNPYCNGNSNCTYPQNPATCSNTCSSGSCQSCTASCGTGTCTNCGTTTTSCSGSPYCSSVELCTYPPSDTCDNPCSGGTCGTCTPGCYASCNYCSSGYVCSSGACVSSYCGDGICDYHNDENCHTCSSDCGCTGGTTCCDCGPFCHLPEPEYVCASSCNYNECRYMC